MRKVAIFSGHRAEWSHLEHVCAAIPDRQLIVTSTLLTQVEEGIADVDHIVHAAPTRTLLETVESMAGVQREVARVLSATRPDVLLVYGDRCETAAAAFAGCALGVPVAHIEGGDETYGGCADDNLRHAITKLASLHFATNAESAIRIVNMGEEAWRVHEVGLPVLDGAVTDADEVRRKYGLHGGPLAVFCMHPVGGIDRSYEVLAAILRMVSFIGLQVVTIAPNGDAGSAPYNWTLPTLSNIPRADYHGLLAIADCVVGNSSAGIKEAPAFGCPCVNIGDRQKGRLRGANVIDLGHDADAIYAAIRKCVTDLPWRAAVRRAASPYGGRGASAKIATVLGYADLVSRKKVAA